jgi:hypothetical protein
MTIAEIHVQRAAAMLERGNEARNHFRDRHYSIPLPDSGGNISSPAGYIRIALLVQGQSRQDSVVSKDRSLSPSDKCRRDTVCHTVGHVWLERANAAFDNAFSAHPS